MVFCECRLLTTVCVPDEFLRLVNFRRAGKLRIRYVHSVFKFFARRVDFAQTQTAPVVCTKLHMMMSWLRLNAILLVQESSHVLFAWCHKSLLSAVIHLVPIQNATATRTAIRLTILGDFYWQVLSTRINMFWWLYLAEYTKTEIIKLSYLRVDFIYTIYNLMFTF